MLGRLPRTQVVALAAFVAVVGPSLGCGQTACFQWSINEGACPDHNQARMFFGDCSDIKSIDDDGKFANDLCCYSVTKDANRLNNIACPPDTTVGVGVGPGTGIATVGPSAVVTSSSGPVPSQCDFSGYCGDSMSGCLACALAGPCSPQLDACAASTQCTQYQICVGKCSPPAQPSCVMACASQFPNGAAIYNSLVECTVCLACPMDCASMAKNCPGSPSSSSSGAGGAGGMSSSSGMGGAGGK